MRNKLILLVKPVRFGGPFICTYLKASSTETDVKVLVAQLCSTLCNPMDCSLLGSSVPGIFHQEYWSGLLFPTPGDLPKSGTEPEACVFPALAGGFFATEPLGSQ